MIELTKGEMLNISGGGIWAIVGIIAGIILGVGILDGYTRPLKCR